MFYQVFQRKGQLTCNQNFFLKWLPIQFNMGFFKVKLYINSTKKLLSILRMYCTAYNQHQILKLGKNIKKSIGMRIKTPLKLYIIPKKEFLFRLHPVFWLPLEPYGIATGTDFSHLDAAIVVPGLAPGAADPGILRFQGICCPIFTIAEDTHHPCHPS